MIINQFCDVIAKTYFDLEIYLQNIIMCFQVPSAGRHGCVLLTLKSELTNGRKELETEDQSQDGTLKSPQLFV